MTHPDDPLPYSSPRSVRSLGSRGTPTRGVVDFDSQLAACGMIVPELVDEVVGWEIEPEWIEVDVYERARIAFGSSSPEAVEASRRGPRRIPGPGGVPITERRLVWKWAEA